LHVYVETLIRFLKSLDALAADLRPLRDLFDGGRQTTLHDPVGHIWVLLTHQEDVAPEGSFGRTEKIFSQQNVAQPAQPAAGNRRKSTCFNAR
jgi:PhnB protein